MNAIVCRIPFSYGHRLAGYNGRCAHLHGHNGVAEVVLERDVLDETGFVVDFGEVKMRVGRWIDENWDHALIVWEDDPVAQAVVRALESGLSQPRVCWLGANPTAENMAAHLFRVAAALMPVGIGLRVRAVRVWETDKGCAEYRGEAS